MPRWGGDYYTNSQKLQSPGPEKEPLGLCFLFQPSVEGKIPIPIVAYNGVPMEGTVPAYLMGSSAAQPEFHKTEGRGLVLVRPFFAPPFGFSRIAPAAYAYNASYASYASYAALAPA